MSLCERRYGKGRTATEVCCEGVMDKADDKAIRKCHNCEYWEEATVVGLSKCDNDGNEIAPGDEEDISLCRKNPEPVPARGTDWCGEFKVHPDFWVVVTEYEEELHKQMDKTTENKVATDGFRSLEAK